MPKFLFVDTCIYLDFYRIRTDLKNGFLAHLEAIKDSLITTDQVEMEYKKNRQDAILDGMQILKTPSGFTVPPLLRDDKSSTALETDIAKMTKRIKKLRQRFDAILKDPIRNDRVFQVMQRLFKKKQPIDLYRKSEQRYDLRELAKKRHLLGYPPRKKSDTSIGDAINWEWIVHVAKENNADIIIVSRDGDYGINRDNSGYLNDWLKQEFRERVNRQRSVELYPLLSRALKEFKVQVSIEEEREEETLVKDPPMISTSVCSQDELQGSIELPELLPAK